MTNWMRRRIERSRGRCEKSAEEHKSNKAQASTTKRQNDDGRGAPSPAQTNPR
jgi:hypothetical protein